MALKILSLNVNGLKQKFKHDIIFFHASVIWDSIYITQTTNIVEESKFSNYGRGKFWYFGTTKSCGVGFLLNNNLSFKLVSQARDTDGRLLCIDINLADRKYRLINVYMHNDAANRKHFINDLEGNLITPREIISDGDFNFLENIE